MPTPTCGSAQSRAESNLPRPRPADNHGCPARVANSGIHTSAVGKQQRAFPARSPAYSPRRSKRTARGAQRARLPAIARPGGSGQCDGRDPERLLLGTAHPAQALDPSYRSCVCTETLAKPVQELAASVMCLERSRAALLMKLPSAAASAAARRLHACQGGRRAPPRRRPGTAHELPRLRRPRAALQRLRASVRVGAPRTRLVPGMSDDGRAVAPPLTDPHASAWLASPRTKRASRHLT